MEGAEPPQVPCVGLCPPLVTATRKDRARVAPGAATPDRQGHSIVKEKGKRGEKQRKKMEKKDTGTKRWEKDEKKKDKKRGGKKRQKKRGKKTK